MPSPCATPCPCLSCTLHAGARRSVTCRAGDEGAVLVNLSRDLFIAFIAARPRTLQIYLHKARCGRACLGGPDHPD